MTANAAERLLQHYVDNFRTLPWRSPPGAASPDPYRVWLSEVMLQQTTVAAVSPRFRRFVERWPTVNALAAAADEAVLAEWAGLGYYARARNLIACAREVCRRGGFPRTEAELRQLPGIGAYTAAAIAAIAFGQAAPAVDTNVRRVVARLSGIRQPSAGQIEREMLSIMPPGRSGDFVQAVMDLGATVCLPRSPRCTKCPLVDRCTAAASGAPEAFPERRVKPKRPHKHAIANWIQRDGAVWLVRRPARGLLGGMAALPTSELTAALPTIGQHLGTVRHVFTHFTLDLYIVDAGEPEDDGWWHPLDKLAEAGLPTLYRRATNLALFEQAQAAGQRAAAA